jgi:hypothetical protein
MEETQTIPVNDRTPKALVRKLSLNPFGFKGGFDHGGEKSDKLSTSTFHSPKCADRSFDEADVVEEDYNPEPQAAPGASIAVGHTVENSIPLSIFPIAMDKFCILFCGLPGRGKTHISRRLERYLSFFHAMPVQIFNVGEMRRKNSVECSTQADFFDANNASAMEQRSKFSQQVTDQMVKFLAQHQSAVAIHDATNFNHERRMNLLRAVRYNTIQVASSLHDTY